MEKERWKWVKGFRGSYMVSTHGRVYSIPRKITPNQYGGQSRKIRGRFLKLIKANNTGYPYVNLYCARSVRRYNVHSLVLNSFVGPCPEGMECRHINDVKGDNHLSNLCWGTREQNIGDRKLNGKGNEGERHGMSKLNEKAVKEIKNNEKIESRYYRKTHKHYAIKYGVSAAAIQMVAAGKTWKHI